MIFLLILAVAQAQRTSTNSMGNGTWLYVGQQLISDNGAYTASVFGDGKLTVVLNQNIVLYKSDSPPSLGQGLFGLTIWNAMEMAIYDNSTTP